MRNLLQQLPLTAVTSLEGLIVAAPIGVTSFVLPPHSVTEGNAQQLLKYLSQCTNLAVLKLGENDIGLEGAQALATILGGLKQLQHLDLGSNNLGPEGAKTLAPILAQLQQLQHLCLSWNNFGREGVIALASVLGQLQQLQHLDLSENKLGLEGAKALALFLPQLRELQHLYLYHNDLKDEGKQKILDALLCTNITQCLGLDDTAVQGIFTKRETILQIVLILLLGAKRTTREKIEAGQGIWLPPELLKRIYEEFLMVAVPNELNSNPPEQNSNTPIPTKNAPGM